MQIEKLSRLIEWYLSLDEDLNYSEEFCEEYMDLFYNIQRDIEKEVSAEVYEFYDEINLICDSYEKNDEIRKEDKYCIDEKELKNKLIKCYKKICDKYRGE